MKCESKLSQFNSNLWHFHFPVPKSISNYFIESKKTKRVVCKINDVFSFQCALMPSSEGFYFINVNKNIRAQLNIQVGDTVWLDITEDMSTYGLPVPVEFSELMKIDDVGNRRFHEQTKGVQRSLLHIIGNAKSSEIRLKRAVLIIDFLKLYNGKFDFKKYNEYLKGR